MPVAPQVPNDPIDVGETGFEEEESNVVYFADSDDLEVVTDYVALVEAQANAAAAAADAANATATSAISTANGKNKVTFSTNAASGTYTNIAVGDLWFQRNGTTGVITGSWEWTGSAWSSKTFGDAVLNSLTAGKITAGTIDLGIGVNVSSSTTGNRVVLDASGLRLYKTSGGGEQATVVLSTSTGEGIFTGNVTASSGNIAGFTINANNLYSSVGTGFFIYSSPNNGYSIIANGAVDAAGGFQSQGRTLDIYSPSAGGNAAWQINTNFYPSVNSGLRLGVSAYRWSEIWQASGSVTGSDSRLKTDIQDSTLGLDFIKALRPVSYKYVVGKNEQVIDEETGKPTGEVVTVPGQRPHFGLIAQEVKDTLDAVAPGQDFAGWIKDDLNDPDSLQSLRYEEFISPLIKAVQQLSAQVEQLSARITELENKP